MTPTKEWPAKLDPDLWQEIQRRWNAYRGIEAELAQLRRVRKAAIALCDWFYDIDRNRTPTANEYEILDELLAVLDNALEAR